MTEHNLLNRGIDSVVYITENRAYTKSDAALRVARHMSGLYPALFIFIIVPRFIRNGVYDLIGRNRYRWFGTQESCMMPTPELQTRFLDTTPVV